MELTPSSAISSRATGSNTTDRPTRARAQREPAWPALARWANTPHADATSAPPTAKATEASRNGTSAAACPISRGTSCRYPAYDCSRCQGCASACGRYMRGSSPYTLSHTGLPPTRASITTGPSAITTT